MHFSKAAAVLAAILALTGPVFSQENSPADLLEGVWQMLPPEGVDASEPHFTGQIVFSEAGTMSVQAMDPDPTLTTTYMVDGYEAFYGTYEVDEAGGTFVVTVESALGRDLIGQELERAFEVTEGRLTLTPTNPEEKWRVTYERL
ncbi:hypothetical protein ASD83_05160 [Devosia sp. Root685]|uniref:lipocalin-like domain-containing protein n=1 Tax=Devosia sp. Root685 TaxID=1736587 RepID=UPI0006F9D9FB|nr:lipocalin-like domain-containing protein [Devosia sp. Root685]KRA99877.1 hypothetical protein ASD83_05160 [Devosia sp. Root685]